MIPYRSFILLATFLLSYNIFPNVHYQQAYSEIVDMLEGNKPLSVCEKEMRIAEELDAERDCCNTSRKFNT